MLQSHHRISLCTPYIQICCTVKSQQKDGDPRYTSVAKNTKAYYCQRNVKRMSLVVELMRLNKPSVRWGAVMGPFYAQRITAMTPCADLSDSAASKRCS